MTFRDLDTKGKIEHIWEYYRLRIFMIVFLICVAISFIYVIFIKPHPDLYCGVAVYDQFMSMEDIDNMTAELDGRFGLDPDKYTVDIQSFYTDNTDVMVEAQLNQKFNTYIYASQFHLLLSNKDNIETFIQAEYMTSLTDFLTADEISALDTQGRIHYAQNPHTGKHDPMAVDISTSSLLNKYGLYQDEKCYIGFVPMPDNSEHTMNVFNAFLE